MRIAVCGPHKNEVISKVENAFCIDAKHPWKSEIIDAAAETYKYFNENNVVFDGSAFDFLSQEGSEGYDDVYEQIAINTLDNLDYIFVLTPEMDKKQLKIYNDYQKLFPQKIYIYNNPEDCFLEAK